VDGEFWVLMSAVRYKSWKVRVDCVTESNSHRVQIQCPPKKYIHTLTDGICVLFSKLN
jgi:hypothetical protein